MPGPAFDHPYQGLLFLSCDLELTRGYVAGSLQEIAVSSPKALSERNIEPHSTGGFDKLGGKRRNQTVPLGKVLHLNP